MSNDGVSKSIDSTHPILQRNHGGPLIPIHLVNYAPGGPTEGAQGSGQGRRPQCSSSGDPTGRGPRAPPDVKAKVEPEVFNTR